MKLTNLIITFVVAVFVAAGCSSRGDETDRKVERLLEKMTLEEKIGQMTLASDAFNDRLRKAVEEGKVGSLINGVDPVENNRIQRIAVEKSRMGIPLLIGRDVIHGFNTIFPIPLGMAATFDPELVEQGARLAAVEATAAGVRWTFSPMVDISRDPRWGRIAEGSGEDTYLTCRMGEAMIRGYQGADRNHASMAACVKHFVGYGAAEGGRDYNSTGLTERALRNIYLPPFEACIKAGALTLMTSFNDNDGVPSTGNKFTLKKVLTDEWGFDGMVVSDWNSTGEMVSHGYARNLKEAAQIAVEAGVDMDMMSFAYTLHLKELVDEGKVKEKTIDDCVRAILKLKFRLGLFDNPYVDEKACAASKYRPECLAAAKKTAAESAILLKNDNHTLPLKGVKTILLTGPMADAPHDQMGTWSFDGDPAMTVTPLMALKGEKGIELIYEPVLSYSRDKSTENFGRLRSAAHKADAIVVCVGEEAILSGEAHSLSDLNLQGAQSQLIAAAKKTGKPVITVIMAGRQLAIEGDVNNSDAVLYSFHPGTMGGEAIADLLMGRSVPSGKSPVTFVKNAGQIPYYYNHNMTGRPASGSETLLDAIPLKAGQTSLGCTSFYLDSGFGPLYPFGYGLSYTTFAYSRIALDKTTYGKNDTIVVSYDLTNTGNYDATEVVQLYTRDLVGSVVRPVRELKRFERVHLDAGQTKHLQFRLPVEELAFWNADMRYAVEPGDFQLWVSGDSNSGNFVSFSIE